MGQKLVNEFFKTLADGELMWDRIIRPEHKRRNPGGPPAGQKYSSKQTAALQYFACKPKEDKKNKSRSKSKDKDKGKDEGKGKGKEREQPVIEPGPIARKPIPSPPSAASSSSAASKSPRRRVPRS